MSSILTSPKAELNPQVALAALEPESIGPSANDSSPLFEAEDYPQSQTLEAINSKYSDTVYHVTHVDDLKSIQETGLRASEQTTNRNEGKLSSWGETLLFIEEHRPDNIPVSLKSCAYGQLTNDLIGNPDGMRNGLPSAEVLRVAVDPETAYVVDLMWSEKASVERTEGIKRFDFLLDEDLQKYFKDTGVRMLTPEELTKTPEECAANYWKSAMPLRVFRELYEPSLWNDALGRTGKDAHELFGKTKGNYRVKEAKRAFVIAHGLPESFAQPEVLIPADNGVIPPERLLQDSSSLVGRGVRPRRSAF